MGRVTGLGGVFFKAENPEKRYQWYEKHLGIKQDAPGQGVSFLWKEAEGFAAWSIFKPDTKYFQPSTKPFMLNFRVEDLDGLLERLRGEACDRSQSGRLRLRAICLDHGPGRKLD
jgi:hypothetical protein